MKINKNQFTLDSKMRDFLFFLGRGKGHMFRFLLNRFRWYLFPRFHYVGRFPDHVDIEATNMCNMKCPMCYRHKMKCKLSLMDMDLYRKIIDECGDNNVYSIRLSWRGEPLMHPDLVEMIRYAKRKGIKEVSFLTNALGLDKRMSRELILSGVDWITVSFDGTGKTYEEIRYPAKYEEALERLRQFQEIKKELKTNKPVLKAQTIWSAVREDPQEYYEALNPVVDKISSISNKDYYNGKIKHDPDFICPAIWQRLAISSNGDVTQCICDAMEHNVIGYVAKTSIKDLWHSPELTKVRQLHLDKDRLKLQACVECFEGNLKSEEKVKVGNRTIKADMQSTTLEVSKTGQGKGDETVNNS